MKSIRSSIEDKKGLSDIVITLLMVGLVLVAAGLIWFVVRGIIQGNTENINLGAKCLDVDIKSTALSCSGSGNATCDVTVRRNAGGEDIAGVKIIFTNASNTGNFVYDLPGNIAPLATKSASAVATGINNANKAEVVAYFNDSSGNEQLCQSG
ncbi:hypothetical protein HYT24_02995 [Candidatus Pacearchaeota archaeon]|nr:hypothetical protein [Candidatus Pacearchaeota archaeon]